MTNKVLEDLVTATSVKEDVVTNKSNVSNNIDFKIEVYDIDKKAYLRENDSLYINSIPRMPNFIASITVPITFGFNPIYIKISIEYEKSIKDNNGVNRIRKTNYYGDGIPLYESGLANFGNNSNVEPYRKGGTRNFTFQFNKIRGGNAKISLFKDEKNTLLIKTFNFKIKGNNPSSKQINDYINEKGYNEKFWFFKNLTMQESSYRQFDSNGTPLFGKPDGFGLTQRDQQYIELSDSQLNYLWDWKINLDTGIITIENKIDYLKELLNKQITKQAEASFDKNSDNFQIADDITYDNITFSHVKSELNGLDDFDKYYPVADSNKKSFLDASLIRLFNGGQFYTLKKITTDQYEWIVDETDKNDRNYVKAVCEAL
jgi:hypothetical protein